MEDQTATKLAQTPQTPEGFVGDPTFKRANEPLRCLWCLSKFRSEEHTSELQSRSDLVCRLLLEKKKNKEANLRGSQKHSSALQERRPLLEPRLNMSHRPRSNQDNRAVCITQSRHGRLSHVSPAD